MCEKHENQEEKKKKNKNQKEGQIMLYKYVHTWISYTKLYRDAKRYIYITCVETQNTASTGDLVRHKNT